MYISKDCKWTPYGTNPELDKKVDSRRRYTRQKIAERGYGLDKLVNDETAEVRYAVANRGYGLDKLVHDENEYVRQAVAEQGYGLDKLINDEDCWVRAEVARQSYGLDKLVNDKDWMVRVAVAKQGYGLDILINDKDWIVREEVAEQGYGLDKLVYDKDSRVRTKVYNYLRDYKYKSVFVWANDNPNKVITDIDIDEWLDSDDECKRMEVAKQGYGLDKLVNDENEDVREAVVWSGYGLDKLINDESYWIRKEVAKHGYGLDKLVYDKYYEVRTKVQYYLSEHGYKTIFDWAEANPNKVITDIDINEWLISDNEYKRLQVAEYGYGLDKLINDEIKDVIETVNSYLKENGYKSIEEWAEANPDKVFYKENEENIISIISNHIHKVDMSNKLKIETSCNSIDEFFEDTSNKSYENNESLTILTADTKIPLIKLEKTTKNEKKCYKFIVDITNEDNSDDFRVRSIINTKEKFNELLISTINSLKEFSQFNKYAEELENCL